MKQTYTDNGDVAWLYYCGWSDPYCYPSNSYIMHDLGGGEGAGCCSGGDAGGDGAGGCGGCGGCGGEFLVQHGFYKKMGPLQSALMLMFGPLSLES